MTDLSWFRWQFLKQPSLVTLYYGKVTSPSVITCGRRVPRKVAEGCHNFKGHWCHCSFMWMSLVKLSGGQSCVYVFLTILRLVPISMTLLFIGVPCSIVNCQVNICWMDKWANGNVAVWPLFKYLNAFQVYIPLFSVFISNVVVNLHLILWYQEASIYIKGWTRTICKIIE